MNVVDLHEKVARLNIWLFGLCSRVRIGEEARKRQVMPGSQFTNRFWDFQLFFDRFVRWWLDSSPDWFGSNQDLDDQTDVIRARLSNTKYDTLFSVSKDYNLTLVEGIYNIVIPNLATVWNISGRRPGSWMTIGRGSVWAASAGNVMGGSREMGRLWGLLGRCWDPEPRSSPCRMASQGRLIASDQYSRVVSSIQTGRLNCLYKLLEDTIPMNIIIENSSR